MSRMSVKFAHKGVFSSGAPSHCHIFCAVFLLREVFIFLKTNEQQFKTTTTKNKNIFLNKHWP